MAAVDAVEDEAAAADDDDVVLVDDVARSSPVAQIRRRCANISVMVSEWVDFLRGCLRCRLTFVCCERSDAKSVDVGALRLLLIFY